MLKGCVPTVCRFALQTVSPPKTRIRARNGVVGGSRSAVAGQHRHLSQDPEAEKPDPIHAYLPREDAEARNASATAGRGQRRPPSRTTLRNAEQRSNHRNPSPNPLARHCLLPYPFLLGLGRAAGRLGGRTRGIASIFTLRQSISLMRTTLPTSPPATAGLRAALLRPAVL